MKTIELGELKAAIDDRSDLVLLEALPAKYYREGHLPGAIHFPHDHVADRAAEVLPRRDARIVVYCASATCANSHKAAEELSRLGYSNVAVFVGGKKAWVEAGLPLET